MKFKQILISLSVIILASCGGGGGGSDDTFIGAAQIISKTSPKTIDTGDRSRLTVEMSEIHADGIVVKIRYPEGLDYVSGSAQIEIDGVNNDLEPDFESNANGNNYLIFLLSQASFGLKNTGLLSLELVGLDEIISGKIEVDADVRSDDFSFDPQNPDFTSEGSASIKVNS